MENEVFKEIVKFITDNRYNLYLRYYLTIIEIKSGKKKYHNFLSKDAFNPTNISFYIPLLFKYNFNTFDKILESYGIESIFYQHLNLLLNKDFISNYNISEIIFNQGKVLLSIDEYTFDIKTQRKTILEFVFVKNK